MIQSISDKRLAMLSALLIAAYAIRVTIPSVWIYPVAPQLINFSGFAVLIFAFFHLFSKSSGHFNVFAMLLLFSLAVTSLFSVILETAVIRTILWGLVFIVTGPFFTSLKATTFRNYLWKHSQNLVIGITLLSFIWNSLHLHQYGKGAAGVTLHCMLLGALAGLATVFSFNKTLSRFRFNLFVFVTSALTCLMSGSRAAVLAAGVGCVVVLVMKCRGLMFRSIAFVGVIMVAFVIWSASGLGDSDNDTINASSGAFSPYTIELLHKGKTNTRQQLWANRIEEFMEYPVSGVGIGVDTFKLRENAFAGNVIEPGSSYLAVLSMTGVSGAMGLLLLLGNLISRVLKRSHLIPKTDLVQTASVGAFWAVHAVAEGWIFAGGSLLCLLFWIWVGKLANLAATTSESQVG
jgi:hypothetical protein